MLNIFWSDARCRAMYKALGDPSSFDSTFLSNRYQMPFCPFVGVNHHGSTILYAAALISYEDTESFEWVFEKWMECMGRAPTVLLTDQCKAMEGAIKKVLPETKHRLCLWHILQNADKNLKDHPQFPQIDRDLFTLMHESITEEELPDMWDDFMEKYNLRRNKWLMGAWDMRQRWMTIFWKDTFCAGMSSTQRSEETNRFVKTYMSIETGLMQFMKQYEDAIEKKVEDKKVNNSKDIKSPLKWDPMILFEDIFSKVYKNSKFREVKTEVYGCISTNVETLTNSLSFIKRFRATSKVTEAFWKKDRRSFEVSIDTITGEYKCGCKMFAFRDILCRHIIKCLDVLDVKGIPDKYILDRWRKDLVRGYENIRVGYYNPDESERVKRSLDITVKMITLRENRRWELEAEVIATTAKDVIDEKWKVLKEKLPLIEAAEATVGFSSKNLLGTGSFGFVFKRNLDGKTVAVNVLNLERQAASNSFMAECKALRNGCHRKLVSKV
ncbi:protein FAR1-RELATED SEQUENCE 8-like [Silene latifolia]|uniref:protein FAR1-RELATED SEQUENCE 8-like n=1 Tax=Silene latifolia TaxID=37657 RepID=UPI003D770103